MFNLKFPVVILITILCFIGAAQGLDADEVARKSLYQLILAEDKEAETKALAELNELGDPIIIDVVEAWRVGKIQASEEKQEVYLEVGLNQYENLLTASLVTPAPDSKKQRASRKLRKELSRMVDLLDLKSPDNAKRIYSAEKLGMGQNPDYLDVLRELTDKQTNSGVKEAFQKAVAVSLLKNGTEEEKLESVKVLGELHAFMARDLLAAMQKEAVLSKDQELAKACAVSIKEIDGRQKLLDWVGTFFRGLSTGSVLLLVSYGLAITFGQMGVINMAHGEFIAIGGYSVYLVQDYVVQNYGADSVMYEWYFIIALPFAFLTTAIAGALLEKGLIQFLYKRPLESLLATWAVSMIMQQALRLYFGAANVSVSSPEWLSGSLNVGGILMSYNRIMLIASAIVVVIVTRLLLSKTNWGLHVRATMQNRQMASSLGVPSSRVNMLTFAFGSGLAGLAGAFISQIGNVGPSMGQTYIVDSFMVVVVGGVGNLIGAAISSMGIGMVDQVLQPLLGPVMGKISVLFMIIIFLQFKPGGLFPARSRSLDD
ncbi:urea ABC transporter permease subunit UrtB [Rubritalea sp.]|uniref:urea ABC transporter permease subunit UrtB n=1 Tax=Rubritalea sp. TaxID=2109375 RepID=UPI003EF2C0B3